MNNYCTNCGKKLKKNVKKCDECNTYVINLKGVNKKKTFHTIRRIIISLVLIIIGSIIFYNFYYKNLDKMIYKKYLKEDFSSAQFVKYNPCLDCRNTCEGTCYNSPKIIGCYKYYYKSSTNTIIPDIIVTVNKWDIAIDSYSAIINKYGYDDIYDEEEEDYHTEKRSELQINVKNINNESITNIYHMTNDIINNYKKNSIDNTDLLEINIYGKGYITDIHITNLDTRDKDCFEWFFEYNKQYKNNNNIEKLTNPNLEDVKNIINQYNDTAKSSNKEYTDND